jgi:hypothetical protein
VKSENQDSLGENKSRSRTRRKQIASSNPSLDIEEHPPQTPKTLCVGWRLEQKQSGSD